MIVLMGMATAAAGLFSGAALYMNPVEHPARLECGPAIALAEYRPSYRRAAVIQASLAALGMLSGAVAWVVGAGLGWLVWGLVLGSVIPFTLVVIMPINRRLLDPGLSGRSAEVGPLPARWGQLHAVRTGPSLAGFVAFIVLLLRR
jgi:hypothetical protein